MGSITQTEVAWAAGLFEGEGFLVERRVGQRIYLSLGVEMRDLDVLERFVSAATELGATPSARPAGPKKPAAIIQLKERKQHNPNHSDIYRWVTTGHIAERVYHGLRDHLGERRRQKGDSILIRAHTAAASIDQQRTCAECGSAFEIKPYGQGKIFCSQRCRQRQYLRDPHRAELARQRKRAYKERMKAKRDAGGTDPLKALLAKEPR